MTNREMKSDVKLEVSIEPQALNSTNNITGEEIDLQGFDSCLFTLQTDAIAVGSLDAQLEIQESDTSGSGFTAAADADLVGLESATAIDENDDKVTKKIGYIGAKRFVRSNLVVTTNAGTDVVGGLAIKGHPDARPQS